MIIVVQIHEIHGPQLANRLTLPQIGHDIFLTGLNMAVHDRDRLNRVAALHRIQKPQMFLVRQGAAGEIVDAIGTAFRKIRSKAWLNM
jgi:hypothetical protein